MFQGIHEYHLDVGMLKVNIIISFPLHTMKWNSSERLDLFLNYEGPWAPNIGGSLGYVDEKLYHGEWYGEACFSVDAHQLTGLTDWPYFSFIDNVKTSSTTGSGQRFTRSRFRGFNCRNSYDISVDLNNTLQMPMQKKTITLFKFQSTCRHNLGKTKYLLRWWRKCKYFWYQRMTELYLESKHTIADKYF